MAGSRRDDDPTAVRQETSGDETITMQHVAQVARSVPAPAKKRGSTLIWMAAVLVVLLVALLTMAGTLYIVGFDTLKGLIAREIAGVATLMPNVTSPTPTVAPTSTLDQVASPTTDKSGGLATALGLGTDQPEPTEAMAPLGSSVAAVEVVSVVGSPLSATNAVLAEALPSKATGAIVAEQLPPSATVDISPMPTKVTAPAPTEAPLPPVEPGRILTDVTEESTRVAMLVGEDNAESDSPNPVSEQSPSVEEGTQSPIIGPVSFSAVTSDGESLEASNTFAGEITEVHALFTYQNMVDGTSWERLWYLDDGTMAKGSGMWDKGSEGTYHLTLAAGGNPLSGGRWRLELYVDGELLQEGEFIIDAPPPSAMPTPELIIATPTTTEAPVATSTEAPSPTSAPLPTPTATVVTVKKYTIAFSRWDGVRHNLYTAQTDGSSETFLLQSAAGPSWSPDGRYLVFFGEAGITEQERDDNRYRIEGISDGIIRLDMTTWSPNPTTIDLYQYAQDGTARWAAWSPSGDMVAYDAKHGGNDWRIYFLGTADNQQFSFELIGEQGDWSPDSNRFVCRSGRDNRQGIWIANRDDTNWVQVTSDGSDAFPRWSTDGAKIAFHRESGGDADIYVMNTDGSNIRRLTDTAGSDTLPVWTPDGRIVFRSARSGSWAVYIMNPDSSGQKQIIANADPGPDWSFGRMDIK